MADAPARSTASGIDLGFRVHGASISAIGREHRNICMTAAYLAADDQGSVTMTHIIRATERETETRAVDPGG